MNLVSKFCLGAAVIAAAAVSVPLLSAQAASVDTKPLCRVRDVSYYYGGATEGVGRRSFDITLIAHDGTDCRLSDKPLLSLRNSKGALVSFSTRGRGGTLRITPAAPLHTTVSYAIPQDTKDEQEVSSLELAMPGGGTANSEPFDLPGPQDTSKTVGIGVSAWTTGLGGGQESEAN